MRILRTLAISLLLGLAYAPFGQAANVELSGTTDLQALGDLSRQEQLPIMLVFTAESCPYCAALEADQLHPMVISGEYNNKVIMRTLQIDSFNDITLFNGKTISAESLASKLSIWVTPTIMFFDPDGKPLAPKIIGYNTPSMFGGYLDESIDQSRHMLRNRLASNGKAKPAL